MDPAVAASLLTVLFGSWMALLAILNAKSKEGDRQFDELQVMYDLRVAEAEHARKRLEQIRVERDEWRARAQRGEITIAQLRERIEHLETEARALRRMLRERGIPDEGLPDAG